MGSEPKLEPAVFFGHLINHDPQGDVNNRLDRPIFPIPISGNLLSSRFFRPKSAGPQEKIRTDYSLDPPNDRRMGDKIIHHPFIQMPHG